jgi:biotin carboxyl carrier protein
MRYFVTVAGQPFEVELTTGADGRTLARLWNDGRVAAEHSLALRSIGGATSGTPADHAVARFAVELDGGTLDVLLEEDARGLHLSLAGDRLDVAIEDERERAAHLTAAAAPKGPVVVKSAMPGIVRAVLVKPGDTVAASQPLVILEAMKMENEVRSEHAGTVKEIKVAAGTAVDGGAELVVIEPPRAPTA